MVALRLGIPSGILAKILVGTCVISRKWTLADKLFRDLTRMIALCLVAMSCDIDDAIMQSDAQYEPTNPAASLSPFLCAVPSIGQ